MIPRNLMDEIIKASTEPNPYQRLLPAMKEVKMTPRMRLRIVWYTSRWPLVIEALRNRHDCRDEDW